MYNYDESEETQKEIILRGRITMMACDIEFSLLCIIMYCNPDPNNHERVGQFKGMRMAQKIDCVIADMKKYKAHYYKPLKTYFDGLDEFRKVRNDFVHYVGRFLENGTFHVNYVEKDEGGIEGIAFKNYSEDQIKGHLDNFSKINSALFALWRKLQHEFEELNQRNPFVHPSQDISDSTY